MLFSGDITSFLGTFRMQDILDVVIISVMIYGFLIWFKKTSSRFMFVGILVLGVVYGVSRWLQLYMTASILQAFFAVLIFALIVLFQEELRRFLERLAIWGRKRKKYATAFQHDIEIITQAVANLARRRIGALIVIIGEEPLDRHIEEGIHLQGLLSQPLLESIFDPHSIGHDGAVLIDRGRVVQFGCHLPLSSNSREFGNVGLRHSAALGLSERTDALCIVVSEERGTISVARDKRLQVLENAPALKAVLEDFFSVRSPAEAQRPLRRWFSENTVEKALAIALACVLWIAFGYQREVVQRDFQVSVEYRNLPSEWIIEEPKVTDAKIMLAGPEQAFRLFNPSSLRLSLDLAQVRQGGQEIALSRGMLSTPSNISVVSIKPERIHIMAYKLLSVKAPVEVRTTGAPPQGFALERIEATPAAVTVLVPPRYNREGLTVRTKPINLKAFTETSLITPEFILPPEVRFPAEKVPPVAVSIKIRQKK